MIYNGIVTPFFYDFVKEFYYSFFVGKDDDWGFKFY
eukprot:CAMPEP_0204821556 /NCGR_PEP_ID=MMETSP1018-20131115/23472_1 /ASSEMBLY_ACC=CAM_ASM_000518 /TAXON_ID=46462 /ORGANISM="Anophryoides haemophila, Strain AH6" /LENGTH=35 /DNA_ID= /DNA_START= /DNA_END= /DNA_ORIENTATION=